VPTVRIPTQLRSLSSGAAEVTVDGATVGAVLAALDEAHPGFSGRLFDEEGQLRRFVNVFVGPKDGEAEDVRFLQGLDTELAAGSTVSIIPAVAGGSGRG
jgi:molybdopterin synthase sulfur carrier subunit